MKKITTDKNDDIESNIDGILAAIGDEGKATLFQRAERHIKDKSLKKMPTEIIDDAVRRVSKFEIENNGKGIDKDQLLAVLLGTVDEVTKEKQTGVGAISQRVAKTAAASGKKNKGGAHTSR